LAGRAHFFHLFLGLGFLFGAKLAVLVGVEFLENLLAHFSAFAVVFLAVLFGRLGDRRK
jgi:hypothetical protein